MKQVSSLVRGIRAKLLILVLTPTFLLIGLSAVSHWALETQRFNANMIARDRLPKTETILMARVQVNAMMRFLWTVAAISDHKIRAQKINDVEARFQKLQNEIKQFESYRLSEEMKRNFAPVAKATMDLEKPLGIILKLLQSETPEDLKRAEEMMFSDVVPKVVEIVENSTKCTELLKTQVTKEIEDGEAAATEGKRIVLYVSLFGILGMMTYGYFQASSLYKSLGSVSSGISETQGHVLAASESLAAASHQASSGATEAASALEETVASIEELNSIVRINADNAQSASGLSTASIQSAQEGEKEIRNLLVSMQQISESSKKISDIISVIDDIAFQTNLLALNASVEAARAGEHGRGFAVVADAVRSLSQKSAASARDITQLIKESVERVENGSKVADRSEAILHNIMTSVKKVADLNNEIAQASREQADGISQISKAMNELDTSVQQNAQAAEEVSSSSENMKHHADYLQESVQKLNEVIDGATHKMASAKIAA